MVENVPPRKVWEALQKDPNAQLVDVRTDAEWNFVGLPDLSPAGKQVVPIQWQIYPTMARNAAFADQLREAGFTARGRRVRGWRRCRRPSRRGVRLESGRSALAAALGIAGARNL